MRYGPDATGTRSRGPVLRSTAEGERLRHRVSPTLDPRPSPLDTRPSSLVPRPSTLASLSCSGSGCWCRWWDSNPHGFLRPQDFKSCVSSISPHRPAARSQFRWNLSLLTSAAKRKLRAGTASGTQGYLRECLTGKTPRGLKARCDRKKVFLRPGVSNRKAAGSFGLGWRQAVDHRFSRAAKRHGSFWSFRRPLGADDLSSEPIPRVPNSGPPHPVRTLLDEGCNPGLKPHLEQAGHPRRVRLTHARPKVINAIRLRTDYELLRNSDFFAIAPLALEMNTELVLARFEHGPVESALGQSANVSLLHLQGRLQPYSTALDDVDDGLARGCGQLSCGSVLPRRGVIQRRATLRRAPDAPQGNHERACEETAASKHLKQIS